MKLKYNQTQLTIFSIILLILLILRDSKMLTLPLLALAVSTLEGKIKHLDKIQPTILLAGLIYYILILI